MTNLTEIPQEEVNRVRTYLEEKFPNIIFSDNEIKAQILLSRASYNFNIQRAKLFSNEQDKKEGGQISKPI